MASQWQAIGNLGSNERAFQHRVSDDVNLALFDREVRSRADRRDGSVPDPHSDRQINIMLKRAAKDL
ncbi:hypothetical protein [Saliphagus sp. LR7]|uniref:hypothetical protein n=1 Tax=Saliphagus sp. LR7 TaxID=2282654 RepID=UPI001E49F5AB|nr:hypothetical protein [Saliphagus sp. LR7]